MYFMNIRNEQLNTVIALDNRPSINNGIHWLNPLLRKCDINRYPVEII
ncbi:MAG: hypothetical protein K0R50_943 [Eubacterium sp.]|nr:hypothetical protein [Eubacterium sp.]